ncbi:hypothetical protein NFI96_005327 [Prochilodus magdalenae]|nr:hypothetical protein NFI96_005327 [Prochilodus magdalenae]
MDPSVKIKKFADDTTVIGLTRDDDESAYRRTVDQVVLWSNQNNLELNTAKTVEISGTNPALTILDRTVMAVESHRFLGTTITKDRKWDCNISSIIKKGQQRMYFQGQLRKFNLSQELMVQFYTDTIESVITSSITAWGSSSTKHDIHKLQRIIRSAEKITGVKPPTPLDLHTSRTRKSAEKITDPSHPGHHMFQHLPSGWRFSQMRIKTARLQRSFFPHITLINS